MSPTLPYVLASAAIFGLGLHALLTRTNLFWKVLAANVMASGTLVLLVAAAGRAPGVPADPVPQAMVLTGIVVWVSATAVALGLALRVAAQTGRPCLPEEHDE